MEATHMTMNFKLAHSAGMDAANRQMISEGRTVWNSDDYKLAASTSYELFPPCAEGFFDVCECKSCLKAMAA
jgi:hypothetical protein